MGWGEWWDASMIGVVASGLRSQRRQCAAVQAAPDDRCLVVIAANSLAEFYRASGTPSPERNELNSESTV